MTDTGSQSPDEGRLPDQAPFPDEEQLPERLPAADQPVVPDGAAPQAEPEPTEDVHPGWGTTPQDEYDLGVSGGWGTPGDHLTGPIPTIPRRRRPNRADGSALPEDPETGAGTTDVPPPRQ